MAFINTGKNRGFFSRNQCHYGHLLREFFGSSCAPGALDLAHHPQAKLESLCSLCRTDEIAMGASATTFEHHVSPPLIRGEFIHLTISILTLWVNILTFCTDTEALSSGTPFDSINIETNTDGEIGKKIEGDEFMRSKYDSSEHSALPLTMMDKNITLNCNADASNSFYGNRGALKCLQEAGEVAILELQYLKGMHHGHGLPNIRILRFLLIFLSFNQCT